MICWDDVVYQHKRTALLCFRDCEFVIHRILDFLFPFKINFLRILGRITKRKGYKNLIKRFVSNKKIIVLIKKRVSGIWNKTIFDRHGIVTI